MPFVSAGYISTIKIYVYKKNNNSRTDGMYSNISRFFWVWEACLYVCGVYFCVERAYQSETVRGADSLSSAQSGNLIRSASNGSSQYPGGEEPPGICQLHQPVAQHVS